MAKLLEILEHLWDYRIIAVLTFVISLTIYLLTLSPTVYWGDSGELATVAYTLGIAHPSGYPTYTILGHLFTYIPLGSIAWRVNLMSAVFASLTAMLLYFICYKLTKSRFASFTASLILAFSATFWSQAVVAEVYTLNTFFMALNLLILLHWREKQKSENSREPTETKHQRWLYLFFFTYGLSLTHHLTSIFLLPGVLYLILVKRQESWKWKEIKWNKELLNTKTILICLVLLTIGLLPYLYLPLRSSMNPALDYGNPENWGNFWSHITAEKYSAQYLGETFPLERLTTLIITLFVEWSWWWFFLLVGLFFLAKRKSLPLKMFFILSMLAYILFYIFYGIQDIASYTLPILLLLSPFVALGAAKLHSFAPKPWMKVGLIASILILIIGGSLWAQYSFLDHSKDYSAKEYAEAIFSQLPQKAVLVTNHDENAILVYQQLAEQQRPDLTIVPLTCFLDSYCLQQLKKGNFIFSIGTISSLSTEEAYAFLQTYAQQSQRPIYTLNLYSAPDKNNPPVWKVFPLNPMNSGTYSPQENKTFKSGADSIKPCAAPIL